MSNLQSKINNHFLPYLYQQAGDVIMLRRRPHEPIHVPHHLL
jgi:hypothetical protein